MLTKITPLFLILLLVLPLAGCGTGVKSPIVGKWLIVEASGPAAEINTGTTYDFKKNGTLVISKGFRAQFTYSVSGNTVTWKMGNRFTLSASFSITGNTMKMEMTTSSQNTP